jgi:hypothetical protein
MASLPGGRNRHTIKTVEPVDESDLDRLVLQTRAWDACRDGSARRAFEEAGISVREGARTLRVGASSVSRWFRGEGLPRGDAALRLALLLDKLASRAVAAPNLPAAETPAVADETAEARTPWLRLVGEPA